MIYGGLPTTSSVSMTNLDSEFLRLFKLNNYRNNDRLWIQSSKSATTKGFTGSCPMGYFRGKGRRAYYSINSGTYTFTTTYFGLAPNSWTKPFNAIGYCSYGFDPATGLGSNFGSMNGNGNIRPLGYNTDYGIRGYYRHSSLNQIAVLISGPNIPALTCALWTSVWGTTLTLQMTADGFFDPGNGDLSRIYTLSVGNNFTLPTQMGIIWY